MVLKHNFVGTVYVDEDEVAYTLSTRNWFSSKNVPSQLHVSYTAVPGIYSVCS